MLWIIALLIFGDICSLITETEPTKIISHKVQDEPRFMTESGKYQFVAGSNILLPCEVSQPGAYVIAWKRGIAILTAGNVKVSPDPRLGLVNGHYLQIENAVPQDGGEYVCQIATLEPIEITHLVDILVPPVIHHVTSGGHLQIKKGSPVSIECLAYGNPAPNITWSRKNNVLPNGEEEIASPSLTIENMDRHKGGTYICTADNGVGQPATSLVVLHVLYQPEISLERPIVHSGVDQEAMLICIVHGEPPPEVTWYKNTMQLHTTERHIMEKRGSRHTLLLRKVHSSDFSNYTCMAENSLGRAKRTIMLTGIPKTAIFQSPPISQWGDRYNISWAVDSHAPVEEFKLFFRRLPKESTNHGYNSNKLDTTTGSRGASQKFSERLQSLQHQSQQQYSRNTGSSIMGEQQQENSTHQVASMAYEPYWYQNGQGGIVHWTGNDWRDVILPAIPLSHLYTQQMSYLIHGLEPDRKYEAKVQARNRFGWSEESDRFIFATPNSNSEVRDMRSTQYNGQDKLNPRLLRVLVVCLAVIIATSLPGRPPLL